MAAWDRKSWAPQWKHCARWLARVSVLLVFSLFATALAQTRSAAPSRSTQPEPPAAALAAATPSTGTDKRIALVIGNARYPAIPLNNPENDARVVAATLRKLGFEVHEHVNLPVKKFRQVLRDYVRRLQNESGVGLLYYAGHGVQIDGRNYLLPVDINLRDEEEIKDEAVDIDDLFTSKLARAKTRGLIIILDACRDNPFRTKTRNIQATGGLAEMGVAGAFIGYSAAPGATAEDGPPGTNSVFTRHLVKEMLAPGVEIETTFKNVRLKVLEETRRRQMPWSNTSLTIDFHFNPAVADARNDPAKQADIARLQAMLERRETEQRKLEEELDAARRELRRQQPGQRASPADAPASAAAPPTAATNAPAGAAVAPAATANSPLSNGASAPAPAAATPPAAEGGVPRVMPSEIRHADRLNAPPRAEPATPPRSEASAARTDATAARVEPSASRSDPAPEARVDGVTAARDKPPPARAEATPLTTPVAREQTAKSKTAAPRPLPQDAARPADAQVAQRTQPARAGRGESERCVELQVRASLGEPVSTAELQKECRR